jgi:hypothetical protein
MNDPCNFAQLRITPCGIYGPPPTILVELTIRNGTWTVIATETCPAMSVVDDPDSPSSCRSISRHWEVILDAEEAITRLEKLHDATVPAFPVSLLVCDGEYVEITIRGEQAELTLGWWTAPPQGAEVLSEFADWLRGIALAAGHEKGDEGSDNEA